MKNVDVIKALSVSNASCIETIDSEQITLDINGAWVSIVWHSFAYGGLEIGFNTGNGLEVEGYLTLDTLNSAINSCLSNGYYDRPIDLDYKEVE